MVFQTAFAGHISQPSLVVDAHVEGEAIVGVTDCIQGELLDCAITSADRHEIRSDARKIGIWMCLTTLAAD